MLFTLEVCDTVSCIKCSDMCVLNVVAGRSMVIRTLIPTVMAFMWVLHCELNYYSLFTAPTRTKQDCLVLSVSAVWTQLATRQDSFVLSQPSFQFASVQSQIYWGLLKTWKLETGSRWEKTHRNWVETRDKTKLSCLQLCSHRRHGQDKTVLSCLFCVCGVNKLLH